MLDGARHRPVGDDAIVVVENVERVMAEEGLPPKKPPVSRWGRFRRSRRYRDGTVGGIRTDGLLWRFYWCYLSSSLLPLFQQWRCRYWWR
ncbi:hypothetical protein ACNKHV_02435 [Shigella flexneri]